MAWIVWMRAAASALKIILSMSPDDGNLLKRLLIDLVAPYWLEIVLASLIIPDATKLLLTTDEETPDKRPIFALGKFPLVITDPDLISVPCMAGDTKTAPVPIFESPVADDNPCPPKLTDPIDEAAKF